MKFRFPFVIIAVFFLIYTPVSGQEYLFEFGKSRGLEALVSDKQPVETPLKWYNVNTDKETWYFEGDELVCKGLPIGVIRSEKQYENFIMHMYPPHGVHVFSG